MAQEYWCCYYNYYEKTKRLNDEELGRLFRALMRYTATGELVEPDGPEILAFDFIMEDIRKANESYADKCSANRINGCKGGRPKKADGLEKTERLLKNRTVIEKPNGSKKTLIEENKLEENKEKKKNTEEAKASLCYAPIVDTWNSLPEPIPRISAINAGSQREKSLKARIAEYSENDVIQAIENVRQSSFLKGSNNKGWIATFDWILRPNNFPKVLEGNYSDRETKRTDNDRVRDELAEWLEEVHI